ncbi:MAG: dTDP-4-dehydrorhamnose 3,5-epimerase [Caldilineaceae bacterium]
MIFHATPLKGAYQIELEKISDERGYFARAWAMQEFLDHGLEATLSQCNTSFNHKRGTVRGMHYQLPPHGEVKLVRCTSGAIFDVMIDLRPDSPSFLRWIGAELSAENGRMLYIPQGFAHGFQALSDGAEIFYMNSAAFEPAAQRGARWNDALFAIDWPLPVSMINQRDANYPDSQAGDFEVMRGL